MAGTTNLSQFFTQLQPAKNLSDVANAATALSNLGGATQASVAALQNTASDVARLTQNLLYTSLLVAALRGVPDGLVDGVVDPFSTTADVNTSASSGYTFTSSSGTIGATVAAGAAIANNTALANSFTSGYPASNAFDGNTSSYWVSNENATSGTTYIGQDFGSGVSKAIQSLTLNQYGSANSISSAMLQYADAASGPWTTANTFSLTLPSGNQTLTNNGAGGSHRFWRLLANANASQQWAVYEIVFTAPGSVSAMTLQSATLASAVASPSAGRVLVQVDPSSAAFTLNTDLLAYFSRDGGTTFTQGTLSAVGTMPDGTTIYDTGYFSVSGQPAGNSTMIYKLTTPTQKAIVLTGIAMQVKP